MKHEMTEVDYERWELALRESTRHVGGKTADAMRRLRRRIQRRRLGSIGLTVEEATLLALALRTYAIAHAGDARRHGRAEEPVAAFVHAGDAMAARAQEEAEAWAKARDAGEGETPDMFADLE